MNEQTHVSAAFKMTATHTDVASLIALDGELDLASAPRLVALVAELPEADTPVVLDLGGVSFVDSSGVRSLLDAERTASERGRRMAILHPSVAVTRLLDLVDLRSRFVEVSTADAEGLRALVDA